MMLFGYLGITENRKVFQARKNTEGYQVENYSCQTIIDDSTPVGSKKKYSWIAEDIPKGDTYLAFYVVHQYVEVSIDGEMVYSLMPSEKNKLCRTVGCNWVVVPLYPEDKGKEISVITVPVYENCQNRSIEFLIDSKLQIYLNQLTDDLPQLILGVMAVLAGIIFMGVGVHNYMKNRQGSSLASLGVFSAMMGLCKLADTRMTPFLFPNRPILMFYISVLMIMLGMVPFMRAIKKRFIKKSGVILDICCILISVFCLVKTVLQIFGIVDIRENLTVVHGVLLINVMVIIGLVVHKKIWCKEKKKRRIGEKISVICAVGVGVDVIAYYMKGNSSGLIFTLFAFLIYIIFSGIIMIMDYKEQEKKLEEQEEELASGRIAVLLSQIQPHFIFNSLSVIETLCRKDTDEAVEALEHFSGYLRESMGALTERKQILFEHELHHVKNYLYMEQKRFGERLQVVYDIQETVFFIPVLTVQPMVENAVRHGICKKIEGGCLTIKSYADEENWIVEVMDNGIGFDVERLEDMGETHVGIANVRKRLRMMCGGRIEINSTQGKGTVVCIKIPKNLEEGDKDETAHRG